MYENNLVESLLEAAEFYESLDESTSEGRKIGRDIYEYVKEKKSEMPDEEERFENMVLNKLKIGVKNVNGRLPADIEEYIEEFADSNSEQLLKQVKRKGTINIPLNKVNPELTGYVSVTFRDLNKGIKESADFYDNLDESTSETKKLGKKYDKLCKNNVKVGNKLQKVEDDLENRPDKTWTDEEVENMHKLSKQLKRAGGEVRNMDKKINFYASNLNGIINLKDIENLESNEDIDDFGNIDKHIYKKGTSNLNINRLVPGMTGHISQTFRQPKVKK